MAKAIKSQPSIIAMLARQRAAVFEKAAEDGERTLTSEELEQVEALANVIANTTAASRRDAAIQINIAYELVELVNDDPERDMGNMLTAAHAALRSAAAALNAPRRRAA